MRTHTSLILETPQLLKHLSGKLGPLLPHSQSSWLSSIARDNARETCVLLCLDGPYPFDLWSRIENQGREAAGPPTQKEGITDGGKEDKEMIFSNFSMVVRNLCQSGHMIVQREANEPKAKFTLRNQSFGGNLGFMGREGQESISVHSLITSSPPHFWTWGLETLFLEIFI